MLILIIGWSITLWWCYKQCRTYSICSKKYSDIKVKVGAEVLELDSKEEKEVDDNFDHR